MAVAEPNVTTLALVVVLKFVPVIVTVVPGVPDTGLIEVMVGVGVVAVVAVKLTALLDFPETVTVTFTAPAVMLGTVTLNEVAVADVTVAAVEPKITVLLPAVVLKFVPVMVTAVPGEPEVGLIALMVGAGTDTVPPRGN